MCDGLYTVGVHQTSTTTAHPLMLIVLCKRDTTFHILREVTRLNDRLSKNRRVIIIMNYKMSYWNKILHELCIQYNIVIIHMAVAILLLRGAHYYTPSRLHNAAQIVYTQKLLYNYYNIRALHSRYTAFPSYSGAI